MKNAPMRFKHKSGFTLIMPNDRHRTHHIPVWDIYLEIVATHSISMSLNRPSRLQRLRQEKDSVDEGTIGLLAYNGAQQSLFLSIDDLTHDLIAHEVFHATHRIMEHRGVNIAPKHHEAPAMLNGFIAALVYGDLKKWGVKIC